MRPAAKSADSPAAKRRYTPQRLLYVGTAVLILLLLATNFAVILHLRESALRNEEGYLKTLSLILAEQAERTFESVDLVISGVADGLRAEGVTDVASLATQMAGHDVHLLLREKIVGVPQLAAVTVFSSDGKMINSSRTWPTPQIDISDRAYIDVLKNDPGQQNYITEPIRNRDTGTWTIYLVHQVRGANGEFLGLILGAMDMRYFEDFYRAISLGKGSSIAILRLDGVTLTRVPRTDTTGKAFSNARRLLNGAPWAVSRHVNPIDGQMGIISVRRLANYPVLALASRNEEVVLTSWWYVARLMSLGALGCAISIAVAAFAFGRQWKQHAILAGAQAEIRRQEDLTAALVEMRTAKEGAEAANRAKSEFLANMSHELRTPLNAVLGFSEILVNEAFGPLGNDRYRDYAKDIHASGTHLLDIINDILDLSKGASGKLGLAEDWFDARELVNSVSRLIQPRIEEGKLSLVVKMPPEALIVYADERLLRQMLLNLLSNACKFTPPGGHIDCSISVDAAGLTFAVTDTGIGIPPEDLERVLEPFVQVDNSLSRQQEGTGLGLALVKGMAELHGGTLRLVSEMRHGTTATVTLPVDRVKAASADVAPANTAPSAAPEPVIG